MTVCVLCSLKDIQVFSNDSTWQNVLFPIAATISKFLEVFLI